MPWTGRTQGPRVFPGCLAWPQRMVFAQEISARRRGTSSARISAVGRPAVLTVAARYSPFSVETLTSASAGRPHFLAKPWKAGVGSPSLP